MRTAGRTVLFSAVTVAAALSSLLVFPQRFLFSMGIGGALVALVAALVALTLLPALLAALGPRVNALSPRRWRAALQRDAAHEQSGFWYRLSRAVMRRPGAVAASTAALLILLGLPFTGVRFTGVDATVLPTSHSARVVDDALRAEFPVNRSAPVLVAVRAPASAGPELAAYAERLRGVEGVAAVGAPARAGVDVAHRRGGARRPARRARAGGGARRPRRARALPGARRRLDGGVPRPAGGARRRPAARAGVAHRDHARHPVPDDGLGRAAGQDADHEPADRRAPRSGCSCSIFQDGRLEGLLAYTSQGALESSQPILLFAIAFGLSTDYGVFLLTRIKEARDGGLPNDEAVAVGLQRTGRIVTAAALLLVIAIGAFATSEIVFIKQLGRRHRGGGDHRRHDRARAARAVADEAAGRVELVGAAAAGAPARPDRPARGGGVTAAAARPRVRRRHGAGAGRRRGAGARACRSTGSSAAAPTAASSRAVAARAAEAAAGRPLRSLALHFLAAPGRRAARRARRWSSAPGA